MNYVYLFINVPCDICKATFIKFHQTLQYAWVLVHCAIFYYVRLTVLHLILLPFPKMAFFLSYAMCFQHVPRKF